MMYRVCLELGPGTAGEQVCQFPENRERAMRVWQAGLT